MAEQNLGSIPQDLERPNRGDLQLDAMMMAL